MDEGSRKRDSSSSDEPLDTSDELEKNSQLGGLIINPEQRIDAFISDACDQAAKEINGQRVSLVDKGRIMEGDVRPHSSHQEVPVEYWIY